MDKNFADIEIYVPGIVIFDPEILEGFLKRNNVLGTNIFDCFVTDEHLGRLVIEQGVLIPIYQIPEDKYAVFIESEYHASKPRFEYAGFPLQVSSGVVVVADLNALFDWAPEFFIAYKANYDSRLPCNDYLEIPSGLYAVTISGYTHLQSPTTRLGYGLKLQKVEKLPSVSSNASVDDRDFTLEAL